MADVAWTKSQRRAITTVGGSLLVSAGAGSGKTMVLAERCAYLVADAPSPCSVDRLLVVTFTEAAATQMRERIANALRDRLGRSPNDRRLREQLALIDAASISTIHAFCKRTLNRYFAQAGLDPATPVMDAHDAMLLRRETAGEVFQRFGDRSGTAGERFEALASAYGGPSERGLIKRVLALDGFLSSLADPEAWISSARERFATGTADQLSDEWLARAVEHLSTELREQLDVVGNELDRVRSAASVHSDCTAALDEYASALGRWRDRLSAKSGAVALDRLRDEIASYEFPKIPRSTKTIKGLPEDERSAFEAATKTLRAVKGRLFERRLQDLYGRFSAADWAEGIARTGGHAATLLELVSSLRTAYRNAKADLGVVDFADLEQMTLGLLRAEENGVTDRLRDQFEHVLVDEYQDVNPIQEEILRKVSREPDDKRPNNLFVVGDVKQSIYRFRLAEPKLFLDRMRRSGSDGSSGGIESGVTNLENMVPDSGSSSVTVIDLVKNFRCARGLIDGINAVFERLMAPDMTGIAYDEHARLRFGRGDSDDSVTGARVELHLLDDSAGSDQDGDTARPVSDEESVASGDGAFAWERIEREAHAIAERIKSLVAVGAAYRDIVVLMRSLAFRGPMFVRTLSRLGVPVFADNPGGFFDSLEIRDLLSLLALMDNERQDIPMASVLRSPLWRRPFTDSELVKIHVSGRTQPFHAAVRRYARTGEDSSLRERLAEFLERIDDLRQEARRRPLADMIWDIYEKTGYFSYVSGLPDAEQRRANLIGLHERARQFGSFGRHGLYRFLRFIEDLEDAEADLEPGRVAASSEDVVRVMSIHRSKGLEFPIVIVAELGKQFNLSDARGSILYDRRLGLGLEAVDVDRRVVYPTLPHRLVSEAVLSESLAEEMRVLYVAMTRARERLILVGTNPPGTFDQIRGRFKRHVGALPVMERRSARGLLDWVLAAVGSQAQERVEMIGGDRTRAAQALFSVRIYESQEIDSWKLDPPVRKGVAERLGRFAEMASLDHAVADPSNARVIETVSGRLTRSYLNAALVGVPAVAAASELKRRWSEDEGEPVGQWSGAQQANRDSARTMPRFRGPVFQEETPAAEAADRGTRMHAFLEAVDLSRPCSRFDLVKQLDEMIAVGQFSEAVAEDIDLDGIAWFFGSPLGVHLRSSQARAIREWPFVIGVDPTRYDRSAVPRGAEDWMLVRGIVDCLFTAGDGWVILDYKTDRVSGAEVGERAEYYRGQLDIYSDAVTRTWSAEVARRSLVFLHPRRIIDV